MRLFGHSESLYACCVCVLYLIVVSIVSIFLCVVRALYMLLFDPMCVVLFSYEFLFGPIGQIVLRVVLLAFCAWS